MNDKKGLTKDELIKEVKALQSQCGPRTLVNNLEEEKNLLTVIVKSGFCVIVQDEMGNRNTFWSARDGEDRYYFNLSVPFRISWIGPDPTFKSKFNSNEHTEMATLFIGVDEFCVVKTYYSDDKSEDLWAGTISNR